MLDVQLHHNETPKRAEQAAVKAVYACPASFRLELQATMQQIDRNDRISSTPYTACCQTGLLSRYK
jgi:hypothetical protein